MSWCILYATSRTTNKLLCGIIILAAIVLLVVTKIVHLEIRDIRERIEVNAGKSSTCLYNYKYD